MKTMMEMLIQLQQLRRCSEHNAPNQQLTEGEKHPLRVLQSLVRDSLPAAVVWRHDRLRKLEPELLECPEIFAMAVLTSTWRNLTPAGRRALETHFTQPAGGGGTGARLNGRLKLLEKSRPQGRITPVPARRKISTAANPK